MTFDMSAPVESARFFALGEMNTRFPLRAASVPTTAFASAFSPTASAASGFASAADADDAPPTTEEISSPSSPITHTFSRQSTTSPSPYIISSTVPDTGDGSSNADLSVS